MISGPGFFLDLGKARPLVNNRPQPGGPPGKGGRGAENGGADDDSTSRRRWFRFMGSPEDGDADETQAKK